MQMGFYFDQTRCTGCGTCVVACKNWHDVPAGKANWIKFSPIEKGQFPEVFVAFMINTCYHCAQPLCVSACPVAAITKREEDGIVVVDRDKCQGKDYCDMCLQACPYASPQFGDEANAKMQKCNLCIDRLQENKQPICVASCPLRALDAGPIDELREKYDGKNEAIGFKYSEVLPSIVFKPKNVKPVSAFKIG